MLKNYLFKFAIGTGMLCGLLTGTSELGISQTITDATPWVWKGGDNTPNQIGVYGTKGVPSVNNKPGARTQAASWTDNTGYFWLFGGRRFGSGVTEAVHNDLWRYNPTNGEWTWISGDSTVNEAAVFGTMGVPSANNTPAARSLANHWKDNNGNLWIQGGGRLSTDRYNDLWKFNPVTHEWTWVRGNVAAGLNVASVYGTQGVPDAANAPGTRITGACWADNSGNLWLFGGQGSPSTTASISGLSDMWKYNIASNTWTWMNGGNSAATAGHTADYGTMGVASATNKPGGRAWTVAWIDANGKLWMFGGLGYDATTSQGLLNDLWKYDPVTNTWTWVSGSAVINNSGTYISKGISSTNRIPRSRFSGTSWMDTDGNLWLFSGITAAWQNTYVNDIWKYNITTNEWTWVKGDSVSNVQPVYNTLNVPSLANEVGSRGVQTSWREKNNNNFWIFGGQNIDGSSLMSRNDLWKIEACSAMSGTLQPISGPDSLCANDTATYTVTGLAGAFAYLWNVPTGWTVISSGVALTVATNNIGGNITVQAIGNCGDSSTSLSKSVYIENLTSPTINQTPQSNDTVLLSVAGTYATYQWSFNTTVIPGATTATYKAYQNGVYSVAVTSNIGCEASSNPSTVSGITSIDGPLNALSNIKIYPNPAANVLNVYSGVGAKITVSDIQGRKLKTENIKPGVNTIDISNLTSGIYMVTFETETNSNVRITQKLIKD